MEMSLFLKRGLLVSVIVVLAFVGVAATHIVIAAPAAGPLAPHANGSPSVCPWLDCKVAAVSYSQDDWGNIIPSDILSVTNSCQVPLENAGLRGTFFFDGPIAPTWLVSLTNGGHEVGAHLANHDLNCAVVPSCAPNCTAESLLQTPYTITDVDNFRQTQLDPNVAAIESRTNEAVVSVAWTCGNTDAGRMAAAEYYFAGGRGYTDVNTNNFAWVYDINTPTPATFMNLNSDWYYHQALVDKAIAEGGWHIVAVHDYCEGVTQLRNISNTVWIAPIGEVLKYIQVRDAAQLTNYARAGYTITFDAVHTLGIFNRQQLSGTPLLPIVYDNPVTIRTPITTTAEVVSVHRNGVAIFDYTVDVISGTKYVWFNTPLTTTQHVTIQLDTPTAVRIANLQAASPAPDLLPALVAAGSAGLGLTLLWRRQRH